MEIIVNSWGALDLKSRACLVKRIGIAMFCWIWSLELFLLINLAFRLCLASRVPFPHQVKLDVSVAMNWCFYVSFSFQCAAAAIFTFHCVLNAALWHFSVLLEMEVRRVIVVSSCWF